MAYTTINKPSEYFNTKLYTGTSSSQSITGVGFQPDMVWVKRRDGVAHSPIQDVVRGATSSISYIMSGVTAGASSVSDAITSFDSDGFSLGADSSTRSNPSGGSMVSWNWKANGAGVSNTDGSITSTVSANTVSGFSIVTYTNQNVNTIGHGLGVVPKVLIGKCLSGASGWVFASADLLGSWDKYLLLNSTNATGTDSRFFYPSSAAPTSTVFSSDQSAWSAGGSATETMVAYCFAEKKGFSKFGKYTGNGNADGPFIYTGFKPALVLVKETSAIDNWILLDNKRDTAPNPHKLALFPNLADAEAGDYLTDFLSNGFKIRSATGSLNTSSATYIYMAFASEPLVGTNNVPATAR